MPPKCKFAKEEIVSAALEITRREGFQAVTARAVSVRLNASTKVIFSLFENMEALLEAVIGAANQVYQETIRRAIDSGEYPPYKASGMAYIRFAQENKELFKLLFMRDRSQENVQENTEEMKPLVQIIQQNTGLPEAQAQMLHLEMWIYVHGIATMLATSYLEWDWKLIDKMLTDGYEGIASRHIAKGNEKWTQSKQ